MFCLLGLLSHPMVLKGILPPLFLQAGPPLQLSVGTLLMPLSAVASLSTEKEEEVGLPLELWWEWHPS